MQLPLQDFPSLVRLQAAAVARGARTLMDVSVGSVLRAVLEANASVGLWVQWLIVEVLSTTRAATSKGADLDSWVGDFGLARLAGVPAQARVRFSRATAGLAAVVPVGAVVRTGVAPGSQEFAVVADASWPGWTGVGYAIGAGAVEAVVPVRATRPGHAGNVQAGVLRVLSTPIAGVDAVVNDFPAVGGLDAETDEALRVRFSGFIDSRARATAQAVTFAIQSVRQGLQFKIAERVDTAGRVRDGHFTVVLDDGGGAPDDGLLRAVGAAIEAVRPIGGTFSVRRPTPVRVDVTLRAEGSADVTAIVRAAIGGYIASHPIGSYVVISRLIQVAHEADPRVLRVSGLTVNGSAADLETPAFGRVFPGTVTVTP